MPRSTPLLALLVATVLAGCGGGVEAPSTPAAGAPERSEATHVHGLGIDPADGSLVVATHSGMFRAPPGEPAPARIGDSRQDTMGFTVTGPGRYLGSGHPDPGDRDLPPLLGLIRSDDGGLTWKPVSLLGEADFHVLRAAGRRIYGVDSTSGALLASRDGGRTWARRTPPGPLFDLAVDPADAEHLVAAGERGLHASRDGGRTWRPLDPRRAGLLAWSDRLVLIEGDGAVSSSADGGRTFEAVGRLPGQPAAAGHGPEGSVLVALHDNTVHWSADGGRTWRRRAAL